MLKKGNLIVLVFVFVFVGIIALDLLGHLPKQETRPENIRNLEDIQDKVRISSHNPEDWVKVVFEDNE